MKKPIAPDWERINEKTEYSPSLDLFWANNKVYDNLSASHNGIIGPGYALRKQIQKENS